MVQFNGRRRPAQRIPKQGESAMGEKGSRDKAGKEDRKKPKLNPKEKRKLKREKKQHPVGTAIPK
jgi:hypothetical protein